MKLVSLIVVLFFFSLSCKKNKQDQLSPQKTITAFDLKASLNPGLAKDIKGEIKGDTIKLAVPSTVALTGLTPSITHTGQSISPGSEIAQNFSNPVVYTVTAADKSTRKYIVVVRFLGTSKEILSFSFKSGDNAGVLTADAVGVINGDTIKVTVDAFSIANLVPSITHNGKQISPPGGQNNSFQDTVTYTVTAEDETTKKYTVVVRSTASLFVGSLDANMYALDPGTGKLRWKYLLGVPVYMNPTYANGTVFIGNGTYLYALNSVTGELKWKTPLPGGASTSPQVDGNLVYIAVHRTGLSAESYMLAVDATTGVISWKAPILSDFMFCNPTVADGRVVTASFYGGLRCYDAATGTLLWTVPTGIVRDNPSVVNGILYIGSESYRLIAIDMATGLQKWALPSYSDNNNHLIHGVGSSPTVHNGVLYTGAPLRAYDAATGTLKWEYALVNSAVVKPVCENGTIFGTSPGDVVFAINSDGSVKWTYGTVGNVQPAVDIANATVAHNIVFTGCGMNNKLIALNAANGQLIWTYEGTKPFISGPCVVDGKDNAFHSNVSGAQQ